MTKTKKTIEQGNDKHKPQLKPPTPALDKLFERIHLLPSKARLSPLSVKSVEFGDWRYSNERSVRYENPVEQWTEEARWSLYKNLEALLMEFQEYIWGADAVPEVSPLIETSDPDFDISNYVNSTLDAVIRYENFLRLRERLHYAAVFAFRHPSWEQQFANSKREEPTKPLRYMFRFRKEQQSQFGERPLPFSIQTQIKINDDGSVEPVRDELLEALLETYENGEKLDVRRIRECAICGQIFWAGRIEKFCCSERCRKNLHSKVNYAENKTKKERREDNDKKAINRAVKKRKLSRR